MERMNNSFQTTTNGEEDEELNEKKKHEEEVTKKGIADEAERLRELGNENFKLGHFLVSLEKYSQAINSIVNGYDTDEYAFVNLHICLSNRSFCNIKLENYGSAIEDAEFALTIKPDFSKALYRRANAYFLLGKYKDALKDFQAIFAKSGSTYATISLKIKECQKQIKSKKFADAICSGKTIPVNETICLETMEVPDSYDGPIYEQRNSQSFFVNLLQYLKASTKNIVHKKFAYTIVLDMIKLLRALPNMVDIPLEGENEITVCGDIHGQFYDLVNIFELNGLPSEQNPYIFNGDFVDRGSFSLECILVLFSAKLAYPDSVHLARGNHETQGMNKLYGFKGEVLAKYDPKLYDVFSECFCFLPLGHRIKEQVLVVHGGLFGGDDATLEDLQAIDRKREPPEDGLMSEVLWSDPQPQCGRSPSKRGVAWQFGPDITQSFVNRNKLKYIIRSHEVKDEGYEVEHSGKIVTVFSAPNYCDQMGNKGAFIRLSGNNLEPRFVQFVAVEHPPSRAMMYANPLFSII